MILSTQTSNVRNRFGDKLAVDYLKAAGYEYLDLSMFHMSNADSPFNAPDWEKTAKELKSYSDERGIIYNQSHIPFTFNYNIPGEWERFIGPTQRRALDICGILGVKYVIVHPLHHIPYLGNEEQLYEYNMRYYKSLIPFCEKYGYKICIENMWQREVKTRRIGHSVGSKMSELKRYIDDLGGTEHFVACLDIGHTALVGFEPEDCIRELGPKYLHALHVHDNDYTGDNHLLPGQGKINWDAVCRALGEINYDGEFTYEADAFIRNFSNEMLPMALKFMNEIGRHLCDKVDSYRPQ